MHYHDAGGECEVLREGGEDDDEEDGSEDWGEEEVETFGVDLTAKPTGRPRRIITVKR